MQQTVKMPRKTRVRKIFYSQKHSIHGQVVWSPILLRFLAGMAVGAASMHGGPMPFGLALCIAAPQDYLVLYSVGTAIGFCFSLSLQAAVSQLAGLAVLMSVRLFFGRHSALWAGLSGIAVNCLVSQAFSSAGAAAMSPGIYLPRAFLTMALAWFYTAFCKDFTGFNKILSYAGVRATAVLLAVWTSLLCIVGSLPIPVFSTLPWLPIVTVITLLAIVSQGAEILVPPLVIGAALGCLLLRQNGMALLLMLCAGWGAAHFFGEERRITAGAFALLALLCLAAAQSLSELLCLATGILICALGYMLLPNSWLVKVREAVVQAYPTADKGLFGALGALAQGLAAVGDGVELVAKNRPSSISEDPNSPIDFVCRQVCGNCSQNAYCWCGQFSQTQGALQAFLDAWRENNRVEFPSYFNCEKRSILQTRLLQAENLRVLRRQQRVENTVLRSVVSQQYRALAEGLSHMAQAWQTPAHYPEWEKRLHGLAEQLSLEAEQINAGRDEHGNVRVEMSLSGVVLEKAKSEKTMSRLTEEVSRCCGLALEALPYQQEGEVLHLVFVRKSEYRVNVGIAGRAFGSEGAVSADVVEQVRLPESFSLVLCDGMGTGHTAAMDAKMTALFTARLLRAGFGADVAAKLVNTALLTREAGDRGSTLDVLSIDCITGAAGLYKAGGCTSWLVHDGIAHRLEAGGLPVGSAQCICNGETKFVLQQGDEVLLMTDGVQQSAPRALERILHALLPAEPQYRAESVLQAVLSEGAAIDDCTVVVLRLERSEKK